MAIVGGCGRVGLPLGLALADRGCSVVLYDRNAEAVDTVRANKIPFAEDGAAEVLERVGGAALTATTDPGELSHAEHVIVVIGTPVDEHLNPNPDVVPGRSRSSRSTCATASCSSCAPRCIRASPRWSSD